jgi:hypothetical protein
VFVGLLKIPMEVLVFSKNGRLKGSIQRLREIDDNDNNLLFLIKAILNVKSRYVDFYQISVERLERVFAYELYHQWSILIDKQNKERNTGDEYILNGETEKTMSHFGKDIVKVRTYPDLVLHKSMDLPRGQAIVCEIKRRGNFTKGGLENDIKKLRDFVCKLQNEYTFGFGVFILAGDNMKSIFEKMNLLNWTTRWRGLKSKNILLIAYKDSQLQIVSLHDALNKKERDDYINKH